MKIDEIRCIGVVGAGQMGRGIAQVLATAGWQVCLVDVSERLLSEAVLKIREAVAKAVDKGALPADQASSVMALIHPHLELDGLRDAQLVVEAASENPDLKQELFAQFGRICGPAAVLASNTSSISITKLGAASGRPDRVVGIHFMNPVPVMRLVEIVQGMETSEDTLTLAFDLTKRINKTPVLCKDSAGFIVNRVLMPMINEAIFVLQEGVATCEAIDLAMTAGTNHPVGPLALADRIGLDTVLAICDVLYEDLGDPKFCACPLLRKYVEAGWLGKKTGRGFYSYENT
jgi:3-hydroxybutyryl-CoA dehydrogenase